MVQFHYDDGAVAEKVLQSANDAWASSGDILAVEDDYGCKACFDIGEVACCFVTDVAREMDAQRKVKEVFEGGGSGLVLPNKRMQ